jgi:CHAT domain-containing protein
MSLLKILNNTIKALLIGLNKTKKGIFPFLLAVIFVVSFGQLTSHSQTFSNYFVSTCTQVENGFFESWCVSPNSDKWKTKYPENSPKWGEMLTKTEKNWQGEYESYFERDFPSLHMTASQISKYLQEISYQTGKKPAVLWAKSQPEQLVLLLITPGKPAIGRIIPSANSENLSKVINNFIAEISNESRSKDYLSLGKKLYDWLIKPVEQELQTNQIDTLMLCLGQGLRSLPFTALYDGEKFLVEKYSLARIPGFNLTRISHNDLSNAQVLAMGASEFKEQQSLPAVALELDTITPNPWQGVSILNENFTVEELKSLRKQKPFEIIHLATHADFLPGSPQKSYIQFYDEKLTLDRINELDLKYPPVELLVLSACQTAVGNKDVELGFSGLAIQSGVKSAIASFWYVSDAGTLALMSEFYQRLKTTLDKAEALKQAQIAMIHGQVYLEQGELINSRGSVALPPILDEIGQPNLSHPFYWASFCLIGSPW